MTHGDAAFAKLLTALTSRELKTTNSVSGTNDVNTD